MPEKDFKRLTERALRNAAYCMEAADVYRQNRLPAALEAQNYFLKQAAHWLQFAESVQRDVIAARADSILTSPASSSRTQS